MLHWQTEVFSLLPSLQPFIIYESPKRTCFWFFFFKPQKCLSRRNKFRFHEISFCFSPRNGEANSVLSSSRVHLCWTRNIGMITVGGVWVSEVSALERKGDKSSGRWRGKIGGITEYIGKLGKWEEQEETEMNKEYREWDLDAQVNRTAEQGPV